MRQSSLKHNVARLRVVLGGDKWPTYYDQERFAKLIGYSVQTVRNIETGRLKLSEKVARRIADVTGVHLGWLLDNDLEADIVRPPDGRWLFTRSDFEHRQALKKIGSSEFVQYLVEDYAASFYGQIRALLSSAVKRDLADMAVWRTALFLEDCRDEFGHDEELIPNKEQFGLRDDVSPYLKRRQVDAGIELFEKSDTKERAQEGRKLFRKYVRERKKIIREGLAKTKRKPKARIRKRR